MAVPASGAGKTTVRRLGPGDEAVVERLARGTPHTGLLQDERVLFVVAEDGDGLVLGFALGYELPRRHGAAKTLFVYEVDVAPGARRQGVGRALLGELSHAAVERGIEEGFVLTNASNAAATALYASVGAKRAYADDVVLDLAFPLHSA